MPPTRVLPDSTELRRMVQAGKTHQEIADYVFATTGVHVTRGAVSSAISRAGLSAQGKRYKVTLPWRVKIEHTKHYAARMLRLLGRRLDGEPLHEDDESRLDSWLAKMRLEDAVVAYIPETPEGFHYLDKPKGYREPVEGVPIIQQEIRLRDIGTEISW